MTRTKHLNEGEWVKHGMTREEFLALPRSKRWRLRHPERAKATVQSWKERNPDAYASNSRKQNIRRYGITVQEFDAMLAEQSGRCAICGTSSPTGRWKRFAVDHCHTTGKVRGLLCNECNRGMGLLRDSPVLLKNALDYLLTHQQRAVP